MKIATYSNHHFLPFWHNPQKPDGFFDPNNLNDWTFVEKKETKPAIEHWVMPILNGLFSINLPGVMAHMSIIFDSKKKIIETPKRVWVQITTEVLDFDGVPVIIKDDVDDVAVESLWGGDNGTYSPFDFLKDGYNEEEVKTPGFWAKFFLERLQEQKREAIYVSENARAEAEKILKKYSVIK